jgi:hypothetical protein
VNGIFKFGESDGSKSGSFEPHWRSCILCSNKQGPFPEWLEHRCTVRPGRRVGVNHAHVSGRDIRVTDSKKLETVMCLFRNITE